MNPIGFSSGPYKITKHEAGVGLTLERFDDYWGGKPQLAGVELRSITDPAARFNALKVGEVHVAESIAPNNVLEAQKDSALVADNIQLPRASTLSNSDWIIASLSDSLFSRTISRTISNTNST